MSTSFLTEYSSRIKKCNTEESYFDALNWGLKEYELHHKMDSNVAALRDPIAAMVIEVFFRCPEAVKRCALNQEKIAKTYKRLMGTIEKLSS
ncbi:MAG: hypothetical protein Q8934_08835 [Bacillota bacterium]|nr:hypothetical protein [Bacillota bacterium]